MDVSIQYPQVTEDLFSSNDWGQLWSNYNQGDSTVDNLVAELRSALEDALNLLSTSAPPLEGCEVCFLEKNKDYGKLIINQGESLIVTSNTKLGENASLPCSGNMLRSDVRVRGKDKISNTTLDGSLESGNPTSTNIMSLSLVSAMKGSREKRGLHVGKLSISWASDVYDPRSTSQSHTLTSHNRHCSTMNKSYRHKHKHKHKAKSPRSSSSIDKKQHQKINRSSSKVAGN